MIRITVFKIPSLYPCALKVREMTTRRGWGCRDTVSEVPNSGATCTCMPRPPHTYPLFALGPAPIRAVGTVPLRQTMLNSSHPSSNG